MDNALLKEIDAALAKTPGIKYLSLEDSAPRDFPKGFAPQKLPRDISLEDTQAFDPLELTQIIPADIKALRSLEARVSNTNFLTTGDFDL